MMRSLYSGVSGLRNHQTRMDVIGNNIANVNTTGFKTSRTVFQDIYSQTVQAASAGTATLGGTNPSQIGLGVRLATIDTIFTSGATQITDNPSDLAIEGDGFFIVDTNGTDIGGISYTRAGNFYIDNMGNLVTADGSFVMGYKLASGTSSTVQVQGKDASGDLMWEKVTEATQAKDKNGNDLWETITKQAPTWKTISRPTQAVDGGGNPVWQTITQQEDDGTGTMVPVDYYVMSDNTTLAKVDGFDETAYPGLKRIAIMENVEYYVTTGEEVKVSEYDPSTDPPRVSILENAEHYVLSDGTEVKVSDYDANPGAYTGVPVAVMENAEFYVLDDGTHYRVDDFKNYNGVASRKPVMVDELQIDYDLLAVPENPTQADLGFINLADYVNISFDETGTIWGMDKAGNKVAVAQIAMAMFTNNSGLEKIGGSLYDYTASSGEPIYTVAGKKGAGKINPGGLEMSNVDLAAEFTDMIITQRGFQANSRIITVSDSMLEELVNLKR